MSVGLSAPSKLLPIDGVTLSVGEANIRYAGRDDLVLIELCEGSTTAALFTKNKFCAAPVVLAKENLSKTAPRALLINSGNANAGTGANGMLVAQRSCELVAEQLAISSTQVLPFSTGVIGEQLDVRKIEKALPALSSNSDDQWLAAAEAIMTTDTVAKAASRQIEIDGKTVSITGMAKGSGMICPNMATMLAFVATDAEIVQNDLEKMINTACDASFNRITVDSDTSTNDALTLTATGRSGVVVDQSDVEFRNALESLMVELATSIIRDGEGATKFVEVNVIGAMSGQDASRIAYSVAHSPLVKTALYASDPNWGRILAAIGKAEVDQLVVEKIDLSINGLDLLTDGEPADSYTEEKGKAVFEEQEISMQIDLNLGQENYHVWTSDLSHDYVSINADYRS